MTATEALVKGTCAVLSLVMAFGMLLMLAASGDSDPDSESKDGNWLNMEEFRTRAFIIGAAVVIVCLVVAQALQALS